MPCAEPSTIPIGTCIRQVRKRREMSQTTLARAIGVERATISRYENGKIEPSAGRIRTISCALQVAPGLLYALDPETLAALLPFPSSQED